MKTPSQGKITISRYTGGEKGTGITISVVDAERIKFKLRGAKGEKEMASVALIPYEVDGWRGYADDLLNHHHRNQDGTFNVSFTRFVDAPK